MFAGWLDDITNWFREQFQALWDAFVAFMGDLVIKALEACLDLFATALEQVPVPEFLGSYSMDGLLTQAGGTILWLVSTFRIGECLGIISAGYAFRRMRKVFTLGIW